MTTHLEIEPLSNDNGRSLFRSQRIKLDGKAAVTPLKALNPAKFRSAVSLNKKAHGFNELYKELNADKISILQKDSNEHDRFSRNLYNLARKAQPNDLSICFVRFLNKSKKFPSKKEIEFLTDVSHSFSDITPMPIIDIKVDISNFSEYLEYVQICYNTIEELNNKPIMGILPNLPRDLYSKLLDFYLDKQISSFCFDFDGSTPNHLKLRPILRYFNTKKTLDDVLIHGINARPGKVLKNTNVIPSKDFIAYGFGLDILGENHVSPKLPKEFFEKMKKVISQQQGNKKRIFIKSDYGYYKTNITSDISELYPNDTKIKLDKILHGPPQMQHLFNMEQQSIETTKIREMLKSMDRNDTILNYIKGKEQIKNELKHLESGPRNVS